MDLQIEIGISNMIANDSNTGESACENDHMLKIQTIMPTSTKSIGVAMNTNTNSKSRRACCYEQKNSRHPYHQQNQSSRAIMTILTTLIILSFTDLKSVASTRVPQDDSYLIRSRFASVSSEAFDSLSRRKRGENESSTSNTFTTKHHDHDLIIQNNRDVKLINSRNSPINSKPRQNRRRIKEKIMNKKDEGKINDNKKDKKKISSKHGDVVDKRNNKEKDKNEGKVGGKNGGLTGGRNGGKNEDKNGSKNGGKNEDKNEGKNGGKNGGKNEDKNGGKNGGKNESPLPTSTPSRSPTSNPSNSPTYSPTHPPTYSPTHPPTYSPSPKPSNPPTAPPSKSPTPKNDESKEIGRNSKDDPKGNRGGGGGGGGGGKNGGGGGKNKSMEPSVAPTLYLSAQPSLLPSSIPSSSPSSSPTKVPTYFPTTSHPTIMKGNPTPAPTQWDESFVDDGGLVLTLSTLTADEDEISFEKKNQDEEGSFRTRNSNKKIVTRTNPEDLGDRIMERIYKEDILNGNEVEFVQDVVSTMSDILCKYTDFVILYQIEKMTEDDDNQYSDYCKQDAKVIEDINSYYTRRETVILVPVIGTDLSRIQLQDYQVYEGSIKGKYLYWIKWDVSCPIVQVSKNLLNQQQQNLVESIDFVKREAKLVMDQTTSTKEVRDILMSKNQHVLSVAADGWEVIETIDFIEAREQNRDDDDSINEVINDDGAQTEPTDNITSSESNETPEPDSPWSEFLQPMRLVGVAMMIFFFSVLLHLIKVGKKRDDKIWEAKKATPMRGDLVSYEGVDFLLQSSRMNAQNVQMSQQSDDHDSANGANDETSKLVATDKSSSSSEIKKITFDPTEMGQRSSPLPQKKKSPIMRLSMSKNEIEVSQGSNQGLSSPQNSVTSMNDNDIHDSLNNPEEAQILRKREAKIQSKMLASFFNS